jgi:hypothetical protein
MPDVDSLDWKVRGTGSRRVLALVRSGADAQLVAKRAILRGLCAMDFQVERLIHALASGRGWQSLMSEFPQIRGACAALVKSTGDAVEWIQQELVGLYGAHCAEWQRFAPRQWTAPQRKAA